MRNIASVAAVVRARAGEKQIAPTSIEPIGGAMRR